MSFRIRTALVESSAGTSRRRKKATMRPKGLPSSSFPTNIWQRFIRINHDYVFRPNLLSHLTVGVNNRHLVEQPDNVNQIPDDWRVATYLKGTTGGPIPGKPSQYVNEWQTWGSDVYTDSIQSTWTVGEQFAWIRGKHSVKFGFEFVRPDYRRIDSNYITGHVSFSSAAIGNPGVNGTTGSAWASSLSRVGQQRAFRIRRGFRLRDAELRLVYPGRLQSIARG